MKMHKDAQRCMKMQISMCLENTSRQKMPVRNEYRQILILLKTFYISYHYNSYILGAFEEVGTRMFHLH